VASASTCPSAPMVGGAPACVRRKMRRTSSTESLTRDRSTTGQGREGGQHSSGGGGVGGDSCSGTDGGDGGFAPARAQAGGKECWPGDVRELRRRGEAWSSGCLERSSIDQLMRTHCCLYRMRPVGARLDIDDANWGTAAPCVVGGG